MNTPPSGLSQTRRPRWMLVDDDALNVSLLGRLLGSYCEAEIECFHDGHAALAAFTSAPDTFDFIITDLEMPGMDGLELCRRMQAISPLIRILLTTANIEITRADAARAGFCGLLRKPFPLGALLEAVGTAAVKPGEIQAACRATR
jgi:CheY-like chemotaxis protein